MIFISKNILALFLILSIIDKIKGEYDRLPSSVHNLPEIEKIFLDLKKVFVVI